jgi:hypothetical protein
VQIATLLCKYGNGPVAVEQQEEEEARGTTM